MTTHLHTRYCQSDVEASKTWVNAVLTYAWYKISRRMRKHSLSFFIPTRMRRHVRSFHHVVEVVDWHFRADDVSSKRRLSLPVFLCLQRRETWETSLHDAWTFRRVARTASFRPWSCRHHARGLENMFHTFFGAIDGTSCRVKIWRAASWPPARMAALWTSSVSRDPALFSGENDDQQGTPLLWPGTQEASIYSATKRQATRIGTPSRRLVKMFHPQRSDKSPTGAVERTLSI